jgi:hypothetical protein
MNSTNILIILSGLVIFSYLFDLVARKTRVPSVLLLLFSGIGLHAVTDYYGFRTVDFLRILPTLGTIGLIMIVLEGALELKYEPAKTRLIKRAFYAAFFLLVGTTLGIAWLFQYISGESFSNCVLNAIPFSVISSSIAIPSASGLPMEKKEFIIYESSFSDILGIILFNFALFNESYHVSSFLYLGLDVVSILLISAGLCFLLLYMLGRINHNIKFFLVIAILIMAYAIGKLFHLSSLVLVLAFGLFLNNAELIRNAFFRKVFIYPNLKQDLHQLFQLSAESAFLLRTFFFVIFGFTMELSEIKNWAILGNGLFVVLIIYGLRYIYLKIAKIDLLPELYITPRGLISILLFYQIPEIQRLPGLESGLMFMVILATSILMAVGLLRARKRDVMV